MAITSYCGTRSRYTAGCRCDDCRQANRLYHETRRNGSTVSNEIPRLLEQIADIVTAREQPWRQHAACRNAPVDLFFPAKQEHHKLETAKQICAACPVATECRNYALSLPAGERHGIWAGRSVDRRRMSTDERALVDSLKAQR